MIIVFLEKDFFKDNVDYIHLLYNKYNFLIKIIKSIDDVKEIVEDFKDEEDKIHYIFCGFYDIKLFKELKLNYNLNLFFMHPNIDDDLEEELEDIHKQISFTTLYHNKLFLKFYTYDKYLFELNENNTESITKYFNKYNVNNDFGFIILRSVNNEISNEYWIKNILQIRKFYNHKIFIIDDNSKKKYLSPSKVDHLKDVEIIKSKYKNRGEILPYYYLYKEKLLKKAVILHDSVFINKYIDFNKYNNQVNFLWHFGHHANNHLMENQMIKLLDESEMLTEIYDAKNWVGCFGVLSVIKLDFLKKLEKKYKLFNLINYIDNRSKRMDFERIFAVVCKASDERKNKKESIYGNIFDYIKWEYSYEEYKNDLKNNLEKLNKFDLIKVWSGR